MTLPVDDESTSCALLAPVEVGAKRIGTDSDAPAARVVPVAGSDVA